MEFDLSMQEDVNIVLLNSTNISNVHQQRKGMLKMQTIPLGMERPIVGKPERKTEGEKKKNQNCKRDNRPAKKYNMIDQTSLVKSCSHQFLFVLVQNIQLALKPVRYGRRICPNIYSTLIFWYLISLLLVYIVLNYI